MSTQSFAELGVSQRRRRRAVAPRHHGPFPVQRLVIGDVLAGRDVLVSRRPARARRSPSASRSSSASTPSRAAPGGARSLAPTRELATPDRRRAEPLAHARGAAGRRRLRRRRLTRRQREARRAHILVATPGPPRGPARARRLHARQRPRARARRGRPHARHGLPPGGRPHRRACARATRQTLFFSATLDGDAGARWRRATRATPVGHEHAPARHGAPRRVEHRFVAVARRRPRRGARRAAARRARARARLRAHQARRRPPRQAPRRATASRPLAMHGNKSQRQRERALARFESGEIDTLVATDVAARGIDVDGISHVINFDPPADHDAYVHRVGRTGRAGRTASASRSSETGEDQEMRRLAARPWGSATARGAPRGRLATASMRGAASEGSRAGAPRRVRDGASDAPPVLGSRPAGPAAGDPERRT